MKQETIKRLKQVLLPNPDDYDDEEDKLWAMDMEHQLGCLLKTQRASLYNSLHNVGDDPVKRAIERSLEKLLDKETLDLIRLVFQYHADYDVW